MFRLPSRLPGLRAILGLAATLVATTASPAAPPEPETPPLAIDGALLARLTEEARTNHPAIQAAERRVTAARLDTRSVRSWPDPMLRLGGIIANTPGPDLAMEGDLLVEVQQGLPLFGKATAERRERAAATRTAEAGADYQFQILRRSVVQAVQQLALDDATLRIGSQDITLFDRMAGLARERQRAGLDSSLELLRVENERERRRQQQVTDQLRRDFNRAALNRLLGRPLEQSFPQVALPDVAPVIAMNEELFRLGLKFEPRLQIMRREIEMAEASTEVTRRSRRPDVNLGLEGRPWSGTGDLREGMVSVGMNLPWFNRGKYRADLARDQARADAARADTADYERDVRQELFRVWTLIDGSRREAELYRDTIIPRATLAVDTALAAWSNGRAMYLDVHEARRMLVEARLMYARAVVEQHRMITELVTCCGLADLDSLLMLPGATPAATPSPATATPSPTPSAPQP